MKTYITINNKRYEAREFDFNLICDLQEMGINMLDIDALKTTPIATIRAYASLCIGADKDTAGTEIQSHIINGGNFDEIFQAMQKMMDESDFFRALAQTAEAENQKSTAKKKPADK